MNSKAKACPKQVLLLLIASCLLANVSADFVNVIANTEPGMSTTLPGPVESGYSYFEYSTGEKHFSYCTKAQFATGLSVFNWKGSKLATAQNPVGDNQALISKNPNKLFSSSTRMYLGSRISSISRYGFSAMGSVLSLALEQETSLSFAPFNLLNSPSNSYVFVYGETTVGRMDYTASDSALIMMTGKTNADSVNSEMLWLLYSPYIMIGSGTSSSFMSIDPTNLSTPQLWYARSETWIMLNNDMVADVLFADCNNGAGTKVYAVCGYVVNTVQSSGGNLAQYKPFYQVDTVNFINFPKFAFFGVGVDYTKNLVALSKESLTLVWTFTLNINTALDGASLQRPASYYSMIGGVTSEGTFYFSSTESVNNNVQFIGVNNCAGRTGTACTSCLPGYYRGAASDMCLMMSQFPEMTGLNSVSKQYTACAVSSCQSCFLDNTSCRKCQDGFNLIDAKTCTKAEAAGLSQVGVAAAIVFAFFTLVGLIALLYFAMTTCCKTAPSKHSAYETVATSEKI